MAQIFLKIPNTPFGIAIPGVTRGFVEGEAIVAEPYEGMLMLEQVTYDLSVESESGTEGRRTVHAPKMSGLSIVRHADRGSIYLTREVLTAGVHQQPWKIYFLRGLADDEHIQHLYLTMTLTNPMIRSQTFSVSGTEMMENLEVGASAIEWKYTYYDSQSSPRGNLSFKMDVQSGAFQPGGRPVF